MPRPTLTAPFVHTKELPKGGRKFTYVPASEVIERLNACLGYGNWSYEVLEGFHFPEGDPQYVVARGRLTALGAVYEQYGGQTPNRYSVDAKPEIAGKIIDLADDYKGAASDAMKKCAAMIGVGLYLSLGRGPTPNPGAAPQDPPSAPAEPVEESGTDPAPSSAGSDLSERAEELAAKAKKPSQAELLAAEA